MAQLKLTATAALYQWLALAARSGAPLIIGAVLSMLMPSTVTASATLPALSIQLPLLVSDWLAASLERVSLPTVFTSRPLPPLLSVQLKVTETSVLFQLLALAAGLGALALIVGLVLSMLIGPKEALALLPALSVQVPLTDGVVPSLLSLVSAGGLPGARPLPLSVQLKLTVTAWLVQVPAV